MMTPELTEAGYIQSKAKLPSLIERRSRVSARTDLSRTHLAEVLRSYDRMIRQYRREIKLQEAAHSCGVAEVMDGLVDRCLI
jgi:hypothetical protein